MLLKSSGIESKDDYMYGYDAILEDLQKSRDIIGTVKAYFEKSMDIKDTVSAMFIHKNTVLYRLNKIKENYSIDVFSVNVCMDLYITIILWKLYR